MDRISYPSDLSDSEWLIIESILGPDSKRGRPRVHSQREVWNAIFYMARAGCAWRYIPHDLPPWGVVRIHFVHWRDDGTLAKVNQALNVMIRLDEGRDETPSAAVVDSQSVKTTQKGALQVLKRLVMTRAKRSKDERDT
jgi:putative transposase